MAWNPFKAIGGAIGRVFGRGESAPSAPTTAPEPAVSAVSERRGGLSGLWDRVTGADRRREEETERERQVEERLRQVEERVRQVEERERQLEERERQVEERQQQIEAREQAIPPAAPVSEPVPTPAFEPAPSASTAPERELPKFASDTPDYLARDERAFGTDSDIGRELEGTVAEFIMDRGGLQGLSADAREWLQSPTISGPFSEYWHSGGFTTDQVLAGMTNISNIKIEEDDDGEIHIEFDYDSEVDGYEVSGHASS